MSILSNQHFFRLFVGPFAPEPLVTRNIIEAPQSETSVSSGKYGDPLEKVYGTARVTCKLLWSKEIREEVRKTTETQSSGGKGGGGGSTTTTTTTYHYYGTFAVLICSNEIIGISKMWLNSKLVYENRPYLLGEPLQASQNFQQYFRVHLGTADQDVDPLILAQEGADNTPAYRYRAYIVFDDLPLADYGNRLPLVEVMAHQDGSGSNTLATPYFDPNLLGGASNWVEQIFILASILMQGGGGFFGFMGIVSPGQVPLHKIVGDLCIDAGLSEDQFDVTELVDWVDGYRIDSEGDSQRFLRRLAEIYDFGVVDDGEKLRFISHPIPIRRPEHTTNCLINEDGLIANSYHDIEGRQGYFPSSSGTSEGQFSSIIAALHAYTATGVQSWRDRALMLAEPLSGLYFAEPPADPNTLYTPHWLFNVKQVTQAQSSILTAKIKVTRQIDGTYTGTIPAGHGYFGDLVRTITQCYDNESSFLVWQNPYSAVKGKSYALPTSATTDASGTALIFGVDNFNDGENNPASLVVNLAYIVEAGKMLSVSEMMEAWPHWRPLESGETAIDAGRVLNFR